MKYRPFTAFLCLLYITFLSGCASEMSSRDLSGSWVARPLSELKQEMKRPDSYASKIGWKETTYPLANGNFVYVEPVGADCSVHWEVNQSDIIVGYQVKGNGCRQEGVSEDYNIIKTRMK